MIHRYIDALHFKDQFLEWFREWKLNLKRGRYLEGWYVYLIRIVATRRGQFYYHLKVG